MNVDTLNAKADAQNRQLCLFYQVEDGKVCSIPFGIETSELGVWSGAVMRRIDIGRAAGQKNSLRAVHILANDVTITGRWDEQRKTSRPQNRIQIMTYLADVLRFFLITSRNSDPGFFHD